MNRRHAWGWGLGALAAAAGVTTALRSDFNSSRAPAAAGEQALAPALLWELSLPVPDGGELQMAALRGRPLVINFWATWCPPCIKELPEIDAFSREFASKGWQVVGLAVDSPTAVREFLRRTPLSFPIGLAGLEGTELSRRLGNAQGALPFTVVLNREGVIAHRRLGQTSHAELSAWANRL